MSTIESYHVHVYYDENTIETAREVIERAGSKFDLPIGRMHEKPVGPHPVWSCQLSVDKNKFGRVIPWFLLNRQQLVIFVHPITGDDLADHTEHALWLGEKLDLKLDIFKS